ncbi:MAG: mannonate dehydratase [Acidobacteria bacterium]|nr:mannonate dehydratase [Acidobacteriota bacterium]MCI0660204.1 mannonate dehydratase [Acidobacteriota bacterium]
MKTRISRRSVVQAMGAAALFPSIPSGAKALDMPSESRDTPKICLEMGIGRLASGALTEAGMRRVKQLGVDHVLTGGGPIPWEESKIRSLMDQLKTGGLSLGNMMISGFRNTLYGRPGRDEEIEKVIQSIRAAGRAGLPVIEYNFYVHRAMEGYYEEIGRAGSGYTAFDYDKMKDLPPLPDEGAHTLDEMWKNITYFLKAVIPEAEQSGVRMALHPNDPPAPLSRGSQQIMATLAGWKKLIDIVPSKSNGITFDCGVTRELGENPVEVCRYFGSRDRINHVHFRNVRVRVPYEKYTEVFLDEGQVDMFAVMKELVRQKYPRLVYPEHPRAIDYDREQPNFRSSYPGGGGYAGFAYNIGYTRAMLQAALSH